ncbi:MAG: hypothetical protein ACXWMN_03605 [Candidatus Limnocylindria bacterium]
MDESRPIMCTLTREELVDRGQAWERLLASGLVERERVAGGIRLRPAPGARAALLELVDLERACCAWIDVDVDEGSAVTLTAPGDGEAVLAGMFLLYVSP